MGAELLVGKEGAHQLIHLLLAHVLNLEQVGSLHADGLEGIHQGGIGRVAADRAHLHRTLDRGHLGTRGKIPATDLGPLPGHLNDEDRSAHGGHRIGCVHLERLTGLHPLLGHADGDLAGLEVDHGPTDLFRDGQDGELSDGHNGPATHEDLDDGLLAGIDAVLLENAVAELQRKRGGAGQSGHGGLAL